MANTTLTSWNTTVLPSNVTVLAGSDNSNEFTRANVIGMFLTLQLCQITQPYGSLLSQSGRFFWRCNPISSFVECLIIFWHLGCVVFRSVKEKRPALLRSLREAAGGLLLLRGGLCSDDSAVLMQKLLTGSFLDKDDQSVPHAVSQTTPQHGRGDIAMSQRQDASHSTVPAADWTLEANRSHALDPMTEKSRILHEALGSSVLAHKELRIDLLAAFTELAVLIKVVIVNGNRWLVVAGVFLVLDGVAIQALLVLLHWRELDELQMTSTIRMLRILDIELGPQRRWKFICMFLHLSFFGYLAYLAFTHPWLPKDATGFLRFLRDHVGISDVEAAAMVKKYFIIYGLLWWVCGTIAIPGLCKKGAFGILYAVY
ncbi:hypothetical protein EDD37DRAFT_607297 [Exophiala viscosa]|uniref:Transmembrane protein n=1 Tax=Exophiala viscosa TaxID=2486360 RepID=A0AAN6DWD2_9EURO|nr:hypothetical protein EDD36DRAFT_464792 [Exophiala viscosa]KAI1625707.1 hypothetical protein EDD37DRAFT_607297 [Exophiala viscosa]